MTSWLNAPRVHAVWFNKSSNTRWSDLYQGGWGEGAGSGHSYHRSRHNLYPLSPGVNLWSRRKWTSSKRTVPDTRRWINVGLMLVYRLRRWTNIKPALIQRLVSAEKRRYNAGPTPQKLSQHGTVVFANVTYSTTPEWGARHNPGGLSARNNNTKFDPGPEGDLERKRVSYCLPSSPIITG